MKQLIVLIALLSSLATEFVLAEQRYVIDELVITVRSGRSNQHNILKLLHSGDKVEVLEEVEENDRLFARIRAGDVEGWVHAQYLSAEPIARDKVITLDKKLTSLREDNASLKQELAVFRQKHTDLKKQHASLKDKTEALTSELEQIKRAAARPLETARQNKQLREELAGLRKKYDVIRQDYELIKHSNERDWFIAGGGVVLISIIFGILLTRIRLRRRKTWSDSI